MENLTTADLDKLQKLLLPHASKRYEELRTQGRRFVHYTSASVAASIFRNKEVWMRSASTMNDVSEVEHGFACLRYAYDETDEGAKFKKFLESIDPDLTKGLARTFNGYLPSFRNNSYITCVSEHNDHEDDHGRLSMWRAYGAENGVAIVLNGEVFGSTSGVLKAYSSPVLYAEKREFLNSFKEVIDGLVAEEAFLRSLDADYLEVALFNTFRFAVLCTKHPGFKEECEWRVIHMPDIELSERLKKHTEIVRGVPQIVFKIPLEDVPEQGLHGLGLEKLINRLIIGPAAHAGEMRKAFIGLLDDAGVPNANEKVVVSGIPLR